MTTSLLATDGYKFSMAEAGFPLRHETFYYSHRRGGPHFLPFDVEDMVRSMLPAPTSEHYDFLSASGYGMGGAFRAAMASGQVVIRAIPKGSWFFDREPVFTVSGPSALVSWLEPLVLQLHYRIQVATQAVLAVPGELESSVAQVTCEAQRDIVVETLESVQVLAPAVQMAPDGYYAHVLARVRELVHVVGDGQRIFEVGMRAATCREQHEITLRACLEAGVHATSNVELAQKLGMKPVGTMGHEHVQRFGSDQAAFRAMRDRYPGPTSFLLDTYSTIHSGLPTAFDLIAEDPSRGDTVRFDSGDKETQFLIATSMAKARKIRPRFILEDGFTVEMTRRFEALREFAKLPVQDVLYGYGGYIVKAPGDPLTRDRVAAVWKVTQSGPNPTMKFGDEPGAGKESIPGRPILYRDYDGSNWFGMVAQQGEDVSGLCLTGAEPANLLRVQFSRDEARQFAQAQGARPRYSAATQALVDSLTAARRRHFTRS
jgi:nicotinic acid phosphoribosyltransferase